MFSLFYLLAKTTKRDFGSIKHAEIKQVLSFKQVSVTLSNFLNRKNKKQTLFLSDINIIRKKQGLIS